MADGREPAPNSKRQGGDCIISKKYEHIFFGGLFPGSPVAIIEAMLHISSSNKTLSAVTIDDQPKFIKFDGQHVQNQYQCDVALGGVCQYAFNEKAHLIETDPAFGTSLNLQKEWSSYWDMGASVLIEGSHSNIVRSRYLQKLMPNSSFVFITCHPIQYIYQMREFLQSKKVPQLLKINVNPNKLAETLAKQWIKIHEILEEDYQYLSKVKIINMELCFSDTGKLLESLYKFLNIEPPKGFNFHKIQFKPSFHWKQCWKDESSSFKNNILNIINPTIMKKFGYNMENDEYTKTWVCESIKNQFRKYPRRKFFTLWWEWCKL
eukprot:UN01935